MGKTRFRSRTTRLDHVKPDGSNWNDVISLGHFRDKVVEYDHGVPTEYWGNPHTHRSYAPDLSTRMYELMWDESHGRPKGRSNRSTQFKTEKDVKRFYDTGGPMLSVKVETGFPPSGVLARGTYVNGTGTQMYEGGFSTPTRSYWGSGWAGSPGAYASQSNALLPDVAPYFDRAWQKAKPKLETAGLFVALREAKDIPRMLKTTAKIFALSYQGSDRVLRTMNTMTGPQQVWVAAHISGRKMGPRDLAEQFLNHQFGWSPFLKDLGQFFQTWVDANDTIKRITMENGKWKRKRVRVTKSVDRQILEDVQLSPSSTSYAIPCFPTSFPAGFFSQPPRWTLTEETSLSISASGKFRFYRPEFDITLPDYTSAWNQVMRYVKIYGLRVNPYLVWQATPWSWLIDWVSNLGSFVQRVSDTAADSVAAAYFYITAHKRVTRRLSIYLPFHSGSKTLAFETTFKSKQRVNADSPYGFSVTWNDLSPRRLEILGALGITRRA